MAEEIKFNSPEEEIAALRKKIFERPEAAKEVLREHTEKNPEDVLSDIHRLQPEEIKTHAEKIKEDSVGKEDSHEVYNRQVLQLLQLAQDKGVLNAVSIAKKIDDPHLEDDFHDALIKYLQSVKNV
jgi:flagellar biosynthesis regulator FlbT